MKAFLAILFAGLCLFGVYRGFKQLDEWHGAIRDAYATMEAAERNTFEPEPGASALEYKVAIERAKAAIAEQERCCEKVMMLLERKPFGLPLTDDEKARLEGAKRVVAEADAKEAERARRVAAARAATPAPAPIVKGVNTAAAASPAPGSWMFEKRGNPLEQKPRR